MGQMFMFLYLEYDNKVNKTYFCFDWVRMIKNVLVLFEYYDYFNG